MHPDVSAAPSAPKRRWFDLCRPRMPSIARPRVAAHAERVIAMADGRQVAVELRLGSVDPDDADTLATRRANDGHWLRDVEQRSAAA